MCRSLVNFLCTTSVSLRSRQRRKCVQRNCCVYGSLIKTLHTFRCSSHSQASQANPEVTFNGQWLAEKVSANIDSLIEIGLSVRGIVTDNHSPNVNAFSALKNIKFRIKLWYIAPAKHTYFMGPFILWKTSEICNLSLSRLYSLGWPIQYDKELKSSLRKSPKLPYLALHPWNNKQNAPLALETAIATVRSYFPNWRAFASFL